MRGPDGQYQKRLVHRKGSTRAMPASHPDLRRTKWAETGHPALIPGSMFHGAAILWPQDKAHQAACSVNHGSGRVMGRGQAKRELAAIHDEIDDQMNTVKRTFDGAEIEGILSNQRRIPLDECGEVYKDLDEVLAVLEMEGIAKIGSRLWPVANIKGTD